MSRAQPDAVIVGRVICRDGRADIEPADLRSVRPFDSERLLEKLTFLVAAVGRDAERLLTLRSRFWSFVRAPGVESDVPKGRPVR